MFNPDAALGSSYMPSLEAAARSLKVAPISAPVHSDGEIETAIVALGREPGGGLAVMGDVFTVVHRAAIILAVARNNVPAVYALSVFVRDGGWRCTGCGGKHNRSRRFPAPELARRPVEPAPDHFAGFFIWASRPCSPL